MKRKCLEKQECLGHRCLVYIVLRVHIRGALITFISWQSREPTCWENVNIFHLTQNIILLTIIWIVSLLGVKIFIKFVSVA